MDKYTVKDRIEINAPMANVWKVLTQTKYYKQWDDLPENFVDETLELGKKIVWEGYSILTVTGYEPHQLFALSMYLPKIALKPEEYNIAYIFTLKETGNGAVLEIEIGDFSNITGGKDYYDASIDFAKEAKLKIKALAEAIG